MYCHGWKVSDNKNFSKKVRNVQKDIIHEFCGNHQGISNSGAGYNDTIINKYTSALGLHCSLTDHLRTPMRNGHYELINFAEYYSFFIWNSTEDDILMLVTEAASRTKTCKLIPDPLNSHGSAESSLLLLLNDSSSNVRW